MDADAADQRWYQRAPDDVLDELDSSSDGLSADEARARLARYGPNAIGEQEEVSPWKVLLDQFTRPLIYVLLAAFIVTLAIHSWADAIVIGAVLVINSTIGFTQEYRAENAVRSLMEMVTPKARVRRDGQRQSVDSDRLVPGDVIRLGEGDMVPADARLLEASRLQVNEAALTGESVPASKTTSALSDAGPDLPPADQTNMCFMGTAVTAGRGLGVVVATGTETQIGDIAEQVRSAGESQTPLQKRMDRLAKGIALLIVVVCALAFGVGALIGKSVTEMFLLAVALAVAAMPAGLPVVMTVALATGVKRMAQRNAIIRHLPAVETLGSTTAILSDKTGTLTQNQMTVQQVYAGQTRYEVTGTVAGEEGEIRHEDETVELDEDGPLYQTLLAGLLNNNARLQRQQDGEHENEGEGEGDEGEEEDDAEAGRQAHFEGDPLEVALLVSALKAGLRPDQLRQRYPQTDEVPFETERKFSATIHDDEEGDGQALVLVKGAPETIVEMCRRQAGADGEPQELDGDAVRQQMESMASGGLRVLAMAVGRGDDAVEAIQGDEPQGFTFAGLQGMNDPPRPEAVTAVDDCHRAGIRVMMITGDHAETGAAIARQVHLDQPVRAGATDGAGESESPSDDDELPEVCAGQRIGQASDDELDDILESVNVYARVKPDQKLRLVHRLRATGSIVAVTGDGVNDAPALKEGDLGAAMGQTGTDVAKEASDMVVTDDNFASIYAAVEEGRTAFRNIRMATFFLLSTGAADVLIILTGLGLGWPLPLLPAQLLWCNVVTNGIQDVALAFEPGEQALYRRPPRPPNEGILDRLLLERLVIVGIWLAAGTVGIFYWQYSGGAQLTYTRTAALTTLVLFQMVHVFNCRSEDVSIFNKSLFSNKVLFIGVIVSLFVHIAALYMPWTQKLLRVTPLDGMTWLVIVGVALSATLVNELHKRLRPRKV